MSDEEMNAIIAIFMGGRYEFDGDPEWGGGWTWVGLVEGKKYWVNTDELKYNTSWKWLLPVLMKIYKDYGVVILPYFSVRNTYLSVVEFLLKNENSS